MAVTSLGGSFVTATSMQNPANAFGGPGCRQMAVPIDTSPQSFFLTDCQFENWDTYMVFIYVEGFNNVPGDGSLSGAVFISFFTANVTTASYSQPVSSVLTNGTLDGGATNRFIVPLVLRATSIREQARVGFTVERQGVAWGLVLPTANMSLATPDTVKKGINLPGVIPCHVQNVPIKSARNTSLMQEIFFNDCSFAAGIQFMAFPLRTYKAFIYVEGPDGGLGTLSEGLDLDIIEDTSNFFRQEPVQVGEATPNGVTISLRAAFPKGRMWILLTRYRAGNNRESVRAGRAAVGGPTCSILNKQIGEESVFAQLTDCRLERGVYYYAYVYVAGDAAQLDGALSPSVEVLVPMTSNSFAKEPRLLATPTEDNILLSFTANQQFGKAWIMVTDAAVANALTISDIKNLNGAKGGIHCRRINVDIDRTEQIVKMVPPFEAPGGCGLDAGGSYTVSVYIEDSNGGNDGSIAQLDAPVLA